MWLGLLRLGFIAVSEALLTLVRRLSLGPMRPTWTLKFEWLAMVLQRDTRASRNETIALHRKRSEVMAGAPELLGLQRIDETIGGVPCVRLLHPRGAVGRPLLVYLHGGGMEGGSFETHGTLISALAQKCGLDALVPLYRLAPEHPYPAGHDDVTAVIRELGKSTPLVLAGDSAGSLLLLGACLRLRNERAPMPLRALAICPWVDLAREAPSRIQGSRFDWCLREEWLHWADTYAPKMDRETPELSPVRADLNGLPPLLVQYGTAECIADEAHALCEQLRRANVNVTEQPWPDMIHDWHILAGQGIRPALDAIEAAARFLAGTP